MTLVSPIPLPVIRCLNQLGESISLARRRRHLSQKELAQRIGVSINTVRRMEAGHRGTALVHFVRSLQVLGNLEKLDQLLDTAQDSIGLMLMDENLPKRIRKSKVTKETGGF